MTTTHTMVVEFSDRGPAYGAATEVLGGRLVAVDFGGNRLDVAEELLEALKALVHRCEFDGVPNDSEPAMQSALAAIERAEAA